MLILFTLDGVLHDRLISQGVDWLSSSHGSNPICSQYIEEPLLPLLNTRICRVDPDEFLMGTWVKIPHPLTFSFRRSLDSLYMSTCETLNFRGSNNSITFAVKGRLVLRTKFSTVDCLPFIFLAISSNLTCNYQYKHPHVRDYAINPNLQLTFKFVMNKICYSLIYLFEYMAYDILHAY
jgi:hypothetical protein